MNKWEDVGKGHETRLERMKVFGGWIVRTYYIGEAVALCFLPDINHEWEI